MQIYDMLAQDYDVLNPKESIDAQADLFKKLIADYGVESVLDCACGPGWHLAMLSDLGLRCAGSDLTPEMLGLAEAHLVDRPVPLKQGDYRDLGAVWDERFDMVICMTTSLPHMLTVEDTVAALNSMHDRLEPGGILVVSNGISDALLDQKPRLLPAGWAEDQAFYFFMEYPNAETVVFNILQVKKTPDGWEHQFVVVPYHALRYGTFVECFKQTPFKQVHYYGDHAFTPYDLTASPRLVAVAEK